MSLSVADLGGNAKTIVDAIAMTPPAKYPEYVTLGARIKSFKDKEHKWKQTPQEFAEAGFFFKGYGDCVTCFACAGSFTGWREGEKPWVIHAHFYVRCSFVQTMKGLEFVRKAQNCDFDGVMDHQTSLQDPSNSLTCKVCLERPSNIVYLPCRHLVSCAECKTHITHCPLCRKVCIAILRVFLT